MTRGAGKGESTEKQGMKVRDQPRGSVTKFVFANNQFAENSAEFPPLLILSGLFYSISVIAVSSSTIHDSSGDLYYTRFMRK